MAKGKAPINNEIRLRSQIVTSNEDAYNSDGVAMPIVSIESRILTIRGQYVMIDRDLASLYGVETKVLNQAVRRNVARFPERFMFQLAKEEQMQLVTNCDRFNMLKHSTVAPHAFTEQGIAMLSAVLRSPTAISVSIKIMDAFTAMRRFLVNNAQVFQRLETIEYHQLEMKRHQDDTDKRIDEVFHRLDEKEMQPRQGIFYDGQVYDAYAFVSGLIKKATKDIVLIDNYIDETVLTLLDKRQQGVAATIYTAAISAQLQLDINRHNSQYAPIAVNVFRRSHDRFLCIDDEVYHVCASIKDLGKKWFAFSRMEDLTKMELISKIR